MLLNLIVFADRQDLAGLSPKPTLEEKIPCSVKQGHGAIFHPFC